MYKYIAEKSKDIVINILNTDELYEFLEVFSKELSDLKDDSSARLKEILASEEATNYIFNELFKHKISINLYDLMFDLRFSFLVVVKSNYIKVKEKYKDDIIKEIVIDDGKRVIFYGEFLGGIK